MQIGNVVERINSSIRDVKVGKLYIVTDTVQKNGKTTTIQIKHKNGQPITLPNFKFIAKNFTLVEPLTKKVLNKQLTRQDIKEMITDGYFAGLNNKVFNADQILDEYLKNK